MNLPVGRAVHAFMSLMGQPTPDRVVPLTPDRWELRTDLIAEEAKELDEAYQEGDDAAFLDACVDLVYVIVGTAVERGMPFDKAFAAVHMANMAKAVKCVDCIGGSVQADTDGTLRWEKCPACNGSQVVVKFRDDGKVLKPVGWVAPDIEKIITEAGASVEGE